MAGSWSKVFRLASRDYVHEWLMSGCFVLALAAVLGPMMVLFGLKFGIVGAMVDELIENPLNREIRPVGSGYYDHAWLESVRARPDVAFLVPRTRSIAATIELSSQHSSRIVTVELMASDHGDPLLPQDSPLPEGTTRVVLSRSAADKLDVAPGDILDGSLARRFRGQQERVHLPLSVAAIAPAQAFTRDGAFVSLTLLEALEDFRDGRAVPPLGWEGEPADANRTYPGFRLYARTIYDVEGLRDAFARLNVDVHTRSAEIELVQRMNRNLTAIYWAIAIVGLVGFSLSLGASLWANIDRKRKELSVLRLVGFRTADIVWFPMVQALFTAVLGWALAVAIYLATALVINDMLAAQLETGQQVCRLLPWHYAIALLLTCTAAVLAAGLAGLRSARVEPSEGLRDL
ncbi:MAG: ABC transporter permease [Gammaproteobacteria bacterium]|jgi:putative ABC transport system permease protein|nr:ABC transporter permease [Gammaproteobacteria bacterium]